MACISLLPFRSGFDVAAFISCDGIYCRSCTIFHILFFILAGLFLLLYVAWSNQECYLGIRLGTSRADRNVDPSPEKGLQASPEDRLQSAEQGP